MDPSWWYDQKNIFSRDKTSSFFKIECWNFQVQFEIGFHETSQNFNSFSFFRELLFSPFLSVVWLSWNFVRFHEIQFQTEPESFSFLSWKRKVLFLKKIFFWPLSTWKQKIFVYWLNFLEAFDMYHTKFLYWAIAIGCVIVG